MHIHYLLIPGAALILSLGTALPASADTTAATVTVTGGALAITAPVDAGSLGSRSNTVGGGTISGPLGQVQVNDARSAHRLDRGGWQARSPPPSPRRRDRRYRRARSVTPRE